jgi:hypothetical protein
MKKTIIRARQKLEKLEEFNPTGKTMTDIYDEKSNTQRAEVKSRKHEGRFSIRRWRLELNQAESTAGGRHSAAAAEVNRRQQPLNPKTCAR